jgi:hypothetical protein
MSDRVMLDIETLGTSPGCCLVAVGCVEWSVDDGVTDTWERSVDIESAQAAGLEIDASTLSWWLDQSAAAREQLDGGDDIERVLRDLRGQVADAGEVWANSPRFDCAILRAAYDAVGLSPPWQFWEERDFRTCRGNLRDAGLWPDIDQDGTAHNAVADAEHQAECLSVALRRLREVYE